MGILWFGDWGAFGGFVEGVLGFTCYGLRLRLCRDLCSVV